MNIKLLFKLFAVFLSTGLYSCIGYYITPEELTFPRTYDNEAFEDIEMIYIESFTGRDSARLLPLFYDEIKKRGIQKIISELPDSDLDKVGIVSVDVREVIYVEDKIILTNEPETKLNFFEGDAITIDLAELPKAIRKNCAVSIDFTLRRASTNAILYQDTLGRTFQQVYNSPISIEERPDAEFETDRLSRLIFSSFAEKIDVVTDTKLYVLEVGIAYNSELRGKLFMDGDSVIIKGLRYAYGQLWDLAILTWLGAVYEPYKYTNKEVYLSNRASAFFNIGQVYRLNKAWGKAAEMFAEANLSYPRLHYAQFWADMIIQKQLEELNPIEIEELSLTESNKKITIQIENLMAVKDRELYDLQVQEKIVDLRTMDKMYILKKEYLYDQINNI